MAVTTVPGAMAGGALPPRSAWSVIHYRQRGTDRRARSNFARRPGSSSVSGSISANAVSIAAAAVDAAPGAGLGTDHDDPGVGRRGAAPQRDREPEDAITDDDDLARVRAECRRFRIPMVHATIVAHRGPLGIQ